jgi:hypothetical protein
MAAGAFVGLMLLALLYTAAASTTISPGSAAGVRWRNMSPVALVVPMLILFAARARASRRRSGDSPHRARAPIAGVAVALVIAVSAMAAHLGERDRFITSHQRRVTATQDRLAELASGRGRVAFWTESSQDYLGAQSFHFWGNYRYANHAYDQQLASWFPRYTFLRLRNFPGVSGADTAGDSAGTTRSRYGPLGEWYWNVRHTLLVDRPHYTSFQGVVAGKGVEGTVGLLALPAEELPELKGENDAARLATLTQRFATDSVWTEAIAGVPWILLARSGTGRRTALEGVPGRPR